MSPWGCGQVYEQSLAFRVLLWHMCLWWRGVALSGEGDQWKTSEPYKGERMRIWRKVTDVRPLTCWRQGSAVGCLLWSKISPGSPCVMVCQGTPPPIFSVLLNPLDVYKSKVSRQNLVLDDSDFPGIECLHFSILPCIYHGTDFPLG